jgi:predicted enzyme related to lactoylglutathione lyase
MATRTSYPPGTFSWVDLNTPDQDGSKRFYGELFGWDYEDNEVTPGVVYTIARVGGENVAAISPPPPGDESPPHWNNYVTVEDADAAAERAAKLGGTVVSPAFDVLEAGRMAVLRDPTGAFFMLWQARESIGAGRVNEPGCLTWNELGTTDVDAATSFYGDLLGWRSEAMPTGDGPAYHVVYVGERSNGGIREQSPEERGAGIPPNWLPYFVVPDSVDATVAKVGELGGGTLLPPMDMPQGGRIAAVHDSQRAAFALWEGPVDD